MWDSLFNKAMFNNTYFKYDTIISVSNIADTQYIDYMYDNAIGVRSIHEKTHSSQSDTTKEYTAFYVNKHLYKIYVICYRKSDIGKRGSIYAKSLYYFNGDTLFSKDEYKLILDLKTYREHFEDLAKKFDDSLKFK
jgi:hypothetical protein